MKEDRGNAPLPNSDRVDAIHEMTRLVRRAGLEATPAQLEALAEYHRRWSIEMAALRTRLRLLERNADAGVQE